MAFPRPAPRTFRIESEGRRASALGYGEGLARKRHPPGELLESRWAMREIAFSWLLSKAGLIKLFEGHWNSAVRVSMQFHTGFTHTTANSRARRCSRTYGTHKSSTLYYLPTPSLFSVT